MYLHILDMSNYLYAGRSAKRVVARGVRETDGKYESNEAPVGAVYFCLSQVANLTSANSVVMPVFDRTPTIKRQMYEQCFGDPYGYKGNRPAKPSDFEIIKEYTEWILRDLGYPVQAADEYESDDVIYSLVRMFENDYERILIHTRDSDLYFLVSENVMIAKVGEQGKFVDMNNYGQVANKNNYCWYNTAHFHKLYGGDPSDNIPGVGYDWGPRVDSVIPKGDIPKLGDLDLARKYLRLASRNFPMYQDAHKLTSVFNIICPLDVPEHLINLDEQDVNMEKLNKYYLPGWAKNEDVWGLEDRLSEYIDKFYE